MSDYRGMGQFGIGQAIKRFEDIRLVRGQGRFHDDVNLAGQAHAVIVRSVHAHARITRIEATQALRSSGVLAVFTGADTAELGTMKMRLKRKRPDGSQMFVIDDAARELGLDAIELRRRNLVPASAMPYRTATGVTYDCGDFPAQMEAALKLADVGGFAARRAAARARGQLRGLGIANAIERAAGPQPEFAEIRF